MLPYNCLIQMFYFFSREFRSVILPVSFKLSNWLISVCSIHIFITLSLHEGLPVGDAFLTLLISTTLSSIFCFTSLQHVSHLQYY